jgi:hypothetical protein
MQQKRLSILLLCDDRPGNANAILDHINAFRDYSRHQVRTLNPWGMARSRALNLDEFDAVVIHYSLVLISDHYVSRDFRDKLRRFKGLKVQFLQDDYRWVDRVTEASREVGIGVLFTVAPEPGAGKLYDTRLPGVRRVQTLTGYVPENLRNLPQRPLAERPIDVGYRGRQLPFWVGRLSQEKAWIAQEFLERGSAYGLRMDIGWREQDRIYGGSWVDFIASCRATLGTESGASITDFDGTVEHAVQEYLRIHADASFDDVQNAVLRPYEGNVMMNVISPRVFEAASLGTAMIMFPGHYSGVLSPGEHYIVLEKDFSNLDEVVAKLKDDGFLRTLTARAHEDLIQSGRWSYETFVHEFDDVVAEEAETARGARPSPRYRLAKLERVFRVPPLHVRIARSALNTAAALRGRDFARRSALESGVWLPKGGFALRAAMGDADLRPIFLEGRRAGMPLDSLLKDILELSLLRRAAAGRLKTGEGFAVRSEFDSSTGSLSFVSKRLEAGDQGSDRLPDSGLEALRAGAVRSIEWDHRAIGATVQLRWPRIEVGIGSNGKNSYPLLVDIGHRRPAVVERALAPLIGRERVPRHTREGVG